MKSKPAISDEISVAAPDHPLRDPETADASGRISGVVDNPAEMFQRARQQAVAMQAAILDALPAQVALVNESGVILAVNRAWKKHAGDNQYNGTEYVLGMNYLDACDSAYGESSVDAKASADGIRRVLGGEIGMFEMEYPCHLPNERRWFRLSVTPLSEFALTGAVIMHIDITERKLAELEIRRTTELLNAVTEGTPDAVFVKDLEGRYLLFNQAAARFVGLDPHEVIGKTDEALFGAEDAAFLRERAREVVNTGEAVTSEEVLTAAGVTRTYLATKAPYRNGTGEIVGIIGISRDITDYKNAREAVVVSEERFRLLSKATNDAIWDWDLRTGVLWWNEGFENIFGFSRDEVEPTIISWSGRVHPDDKDEVVHAVQHAMESGEGSWTGEYRFVRKDGTYAYVLDRGYIIRDAAGTAVRMIGGITDLSEWRDIQVAMTESEKLHRATSHHLSNILNSSLDVICSVDEEGRFLQVNEPCEAMFGYTPEELIGKYYIDHVVPEDVAMTKDAAAEIMAGRVTRDFENRYVRKDGVITRVQWSARWSETERIFFCVARDVTEARLNAERIAEQASLLNEATDAIFVAGLDYRITFWNKSAERLYGWPAEEAIGQNFQDLLHRGGDVSAFEQGITKLFSNGEHSAEWSKVSKDGNALTIEARWTLVNGDQGKPKAILAINTDITERKKLEQQFLRAQRMESIGTLAGGIAHDLNNVLAPIMMAIDLLRLREKDPMRRNILSTIETSARRGAEMVRQVLTFARGVEGQQLDVNLAALVREMETIAIETFPKNIEVRSEVGANLWNVRGDPTQLHQVLLNLCVNARDAMPDGGTLQLTAENLVLDDQFVGMNIGAKPGPNVVIRVVDTGMGMPPQVLERIFEPFYTTKELGKGTGLGLSTTLAIVEAHGGFIQVQSEQGKGTGFHIHLPATAGQGFGTGALAAAAIPRGSGEVVLVVDDEKSVREITRQTLEAFGYQVILAADGVDAIAIYAREKNRISVVLTDMMMPVMDGRTTIRVLHSLNPEVRIIAASGLNYPSGTESGSVVAAEHFLAKPYTAETLLTLLRKVLHENGDRPVS